MKVDEPPFGRYVRTPEVKDCEFCPFENLTDLCKQWLSTHDYRCPGRGNYAEACQLAEESQ